MVKQMKFEMTHNTFKGIETFTEDNPPAWLQSREYGWFFKDYVMKLEIGKSAATEFRTITRIE